jgi:hypothetical protein
MTRCDDCAAPAQWVMLWVTRFPHTDAEKAKKLAPKGPEFKVGGHFCGHHKEQIEKVPSEMERTFRFAGAVLV